MTPNVQSAASGADGSQLLMIRQLLDSQRIAIVGLSIDSSKASHRVASYLKKMGKNIVPVNPNHESVMGLKCYRSLEEVPGEIDLVDVFRPAEDCTEVIRSAINKSVKGIWLQLGIKCEQGRQLAKEAGINYVEDRCLMVEHQAFL
ncbi:MAG TPA: CoA-binding protein [Tepidisphaeraceae bacterium]|nr:CoA-binding protein [Tepidisphaeraceae bacterium]